MPLGSDPGGSGLATEEVLLAWVGRAESVSSPCLLPSPGHRVLDPAYNDRDLGFYSNVDIQGRGLSLRGPGQLHPRPTEFEGSAGWGGGTPMHSKLVPPLAAGL